MDQKDKSYAENICRVIRILSSDKREYLMDVADGMAAMAAVYGPDACFRLGAEFGGIPSAQKAARRSGA